MNMHILNQERRKAVDKIMHIISSDFVQLFFLDAHNGTSETFLTNLMLATIEDERSIAVAFSGIAANLIDGGKTAHSAFKLHLNLMHFLIYLSRVA